MNTIGRSWSLIIGLLAFFYFFNSREVKGHTQEDVVKNLRSKFHSLIAPSKSKNRQIEISGSINVNIGLPKSKQEHGHHDGRFKVKFPSLREKEKIDFRLPRHVIPLHYILQLQPSPETMKFAGSVKIKIEITRATHNIILHAHKLSIRSIKLTSVSREDMPKKSFELNSKLIEDSRQLLIVETKKEVPSGHYTLNIDFTGSLDGIVGLYAIKLQNRNPIVTSKFEPTHAREAFPCFDEPDFKATFDVTLIKPHDTNVALSNMNEVSRAIDNETSLEAVKFATTLPMSTYLLAFVICDYDFIETVVKINGKGSKFKLRSFAQAHQMQKVIFAQNIGKSAMEFFIKYYDVPFPLPKLDMIAIPEFTSGAVEDWGLVAYRETAFLVDDTTTSPGMKIAVATTIAHELAHMWFGNLVTMKWWNDLWLKESFATHMAFRCLESIQPAWSMGDMNVMSAISAMDADSKLSSHPIASTVTVKSPNQINDLYDGISYNKGAAVLLMVEEFMGKQNFRKGISDYLKKHQFKNTIAQDLYSSLSKYFTKKPGSRLNLSYIMDTWTKQAGYPLLTVKIASKGVYRITQSRFVLNAKASPQRDADMNSRWFVPITYKTNKGVHRQTGWLGDNEKYVEIVDSGVSWLKLNNNKIGFYRVNYPVQMWQSLIQEMKTRKSKLLTISDRVQLLNDVFTLADANLVSYDILLNMTTYLTIEEDYVPWSVAALQLDTIASRLNSTSYEYNLLQAYRRKIVRPIYRKKFHSKPSTQIVVERLLRAQALALAAQAELPNALIKIQRIFRAWLDSHDKAADGTAHQQTRIETDLKPVIYYFGMKNGTQSEWDKLWQIYKVEDDPQEQNHIRSALAAPRNTSLLKKYLSLAWDISNIRQQDYVFVLISIGSNPSGTDLVWDYVRNNWQMIVERYQSSSSVMLGGLISAITVKFNTDAKLKELERFFGNHPDELISEERRRSALETVRSNIEWKTHREPQVVAWLRAHVKQPLNG